MKTATIIAAFSTVVAVVQGMAVRREDELPSERVAAFHRDKHGGNSHDNAHVKTNNNHTSSAWRPGQRIRNETASPHWRARHEAAADDSDMSTNTWRSGQRSQGDTGAVRLEEHFRYSRKYPTNTEVFPAGVQNTDVKCGIGRPATEGDWNEVLNAAKDHFNEKHKTEPSVPSIQPGPRFCRMIYCEKSTGFFWCNDNSKIKQLKTWADFSIAVGVVQYDNRCKKQRAAQIFHPDHWNVMIHGVDECP
ncbi:hypothetical protein JDV02_006807 [Purpureocillium takamizusanense]|uniref:Secreted protein n=1 Tax=Purpureocillium takamizusanense TaxID=2060973 RepID=A0A9Q8QJF1_9HYPO|nr:uncharacterized protein JDV02_006807 [Purpureocillium takamizusanense]UNI20745.1 hypothetical protein JDV02_006807 [Purpureocillium takamizusanense]